MSKLKINPGLLSLVLVACIFVGWSTALIVAMLILIFCEMDEKVKNVFTKVISFLLAITLFSVFWDLIVSAVNLGINSIDDLVNVINSYLDYSDAISLTKLHSYLFTPVKGLLSIADSVISYIIMFVEFTFAISILLNKQGKPNFIIKKIEEYVNNVMNFVNSFGSTNSYQNVQTQPVQQPMPQQMSNNFNNQNVQ